MGGVMVVSLCAGGGVRASHRAPQPGPGDHTYSPSAPPAAAPRAPAATRSRRCTGGEGGALIATTSLRTGISSYSSASRQSSIACAAAFCSLASCSLAACSLASSAALATRNISRRVSSESSVSVAAERKVTPVSRRPRSYEHVGHVQVGRSAPSTGMGSPTSVKRCARRGVSVDMLRSRRSLSRTHKRGRTEFQKFQFRFHARFLIKY
mmetsp:Transcript_9587/g.24164  ORF Transcript_9587/g.24164 Transcript_9587/m.24164 type:complete len:209 (+) Transcript_9587:169-795(+)